MGVRDVSEELQFIVLACDGIWDVLSNQEVADFIIARLAKGLEPEIICEELMTRCLASDSSMGGLGCDNMTVILICFIRNEPYQSLVDDCIMMMDIREKSRKKNYLEKIQMTKWMIRVLMESLRRIILQM